MKLVFGLSFFVETLRLGCFWILSMEKSQSLHANPKSENLVNDDNDLRLDSYKILCVYCKRAYVEFTRIKNNCVTSKSFTTDDVRTLHTSFYFIFPF
jgi:hypothetical protein